MYSDVISFEEIISGFFLCYIVFFKMVFITKIEVLSYNSRGIVNLHAS